MQALGSAAWDPPLGVRLRLIVDTLLQLVLDTARPGMPVAAEGGRAMLVELSVMEQRCIGP